MCKMDSSTDSDSETSPRWSDTSNLGCVSSSAPESRTSHRTVSLTYKSAGRHACCSLFLDPYDGSSEDSEEPISGTGREKRQQGGCSLSGQRRRLFLHHSASSAVSGMVRNSRRDSLSHHQSVVQESVCSSAKGIHAMDVEVQLGDSGLDASRSSTYCTPGLHTLEERSSERSLRPPCKRKELPPAGELVEAEPRKKQCVKSMEDDREETG